VIEYVPVITVIILNVCNSLYHKSSIVRIPTPGLTTLGPGFQCLPLDLALLPRCNEIASDGPLCLVTRAVYDGDTWDLSFLEPFFPKSAGKWINIRSTLATLVHWRLHSDTWPGFWPKTAVCDRSLYRPLLYTASSAVRSRHWPIALKDGWIASCQETRTQDPTEQKERESKVPFNKRCCFLTLENAAGAA